MQYIEMSTHYNEYHNTETRKRFYIIDRNKLSDNYEECYTEYKSKYSDDYDFYKQKEFDGGLYYVAVRKPSYRVDFTDNTSYNFDWNDSIQTIEGECMIADIKSGDTIILYDGEEKTVEKIIEY